MNRRRKNQRQHHRTEQSAYHRNCQRFQHLRACADPKCQRNMPRLLPSRSSQSVAAFAARLIIASSADAPGCGSDVLRPAQDAVFATMPMTMIMPIREATLNVVPVTSSARNPPKVESSATPRSLWRGKSPEFKQQHRKQKQQSQQQHHQQIARRFPILLIQAAILNTD